MNITIKSGTVSKDGEEIGQIVGDECISFRIIGPTVKSAINKAHGSKLKHIVAQDNAPGAPSGQTENTEGDSTSGKPGAGSSAPVAPEVLIESKPVASAISEPALSGLPRLLALADAGKIPTPPLHHPAMGDKAPDFVKWFQAHATPDEVNAKYPPTRRIPASFADYERAEKERLNRKLNGEKKDTAPSQDFADADEE